MTAALSPATGRHPSTRGPCSIRSKGALAPPAVTSMWGIIPGQITGWPAKKDGRRSGWPPPMRPDVLSASAGCPRWWDPCTGGWPVSGCTGRGGGILLCMSSATFTEGFSRWVSAGFCTEGQRRRRSDGCCFWPGMGKSFTRCTGCCIRTAIPATCTGPGGRL